MFRIISIPILLGIAHRNRRSVLADVVYFRGKCATKFRYGSNVQPSVKETTRSN
jgi:hypothetical protein